MSHEELCVLLRTQPISRAVQIAVHDLDQRRYIEQLELRLGMEIGTPLDGIRQEVR